jgi:hypothetical protein
MLLISWILLCVEKIGEKGWGRGARVGGNSYVRKGRWERMGWGKGGKGTAVTAGPSTRNGTLIT